MNNLELSVECTPLSLLTGIETNADIFCIYLGDDVSYEAVANIISNFVVSSNLRVIMTGGKANELLHDKIDSVIEERTDSNGLVLTVWSDDGFSDILWEFINVHGSQPAIKYGKVLIISESILVRLKLLAEFSAIILEE
jgi:hypothetical protein